MEDRLSFEPSAVAASAKMEQFIKEALEYRQIRAIIQPQTRKAPPERGNAAGQTISCCGRMIQT